MKESEMRIRLVHQRAKELQQKAEWNRLRRSAGISSFLCIALIAVFSFLGLHSTSYANGSYTGSLLLSESTGGYVLVGVAAFMAGVMIYCPLLQNRMKFYFAGCAAVRKPQRGFR